MAECPAPVVPCGDEEIQNLYIWNCECEPMALTYGEVFDSNNDTVADIYRGVLDDSFTIREWSNDTLGFEWQAPIIAGLDCVTEVDDSAYTDIWNRYRQVAV
jgi:hypothetical protein